MERILDIEAQESQGRRVVYDVDVIQATMQRFALFIYKLPVDLVTIKVIESSVGDVQKLLNEKLVFFVL